MWHSLWEGRRLTNWKILFNLDSLVQSKSILSPIKNEMILYLCLSCFMFTFVIYFWYLSIFMKFLQINLNQFLLFEFSFMYINKVFNSDIFHLLYTFIEKDYYSFWSSMFLPFSNNIEWVFISEYVTINLILKQINLMNGTWYKYLKWILWLFDSSVFPFFKPLIKLPY